jgi:hypothetical protein
MKFNVKFNVYYSRKLSRIILGPAEQAVKTARNLSKMSWFISSVFGEGGKIRYEG